MDRTSSGWVSSTIRFLVLLAIVLFLVVPTLIVMATSFTAGTAIELPTHGLSLRWYEEFFGSAKWTTALLRSSIVAVLAAAIAFVAGISLALAASRGRWFPKKLISAISIGPLIVPLVFLGVGLYLVFIRVGMGGSILGLACAHALLGIPYVFVNVTTALNGIPEYVEDAARASGANSLMTLWRITLPLIIPGAIVGALFAFIVSWDEVVVTLFLSDATTRTLPIVMWTEIRFGLTPTLSAVATVVTIGTTLAFLAGSVLLGRKSRVKQ